MNEQQKAKIASYLDALPKWDRKPRVGSYVAEVARRSAKPRAKSRVLGAVSYVARFVWCLVAHGEVCHRCPEIWGRP